MSGAAAGVVGFSIYLWNQTEQLEREIASLRTGEIASLRNEIKEIKRIGDVEIFVHQECQGLGKVLFQAEVEVNSALKGEIRRVFEERGCVISADGG